MHGQSVRITSTGPKTSVMRQNSLLNIYQTKPKVNKSYKHFILKSGKPVVQVHLICKLMTDNSKSSALISHTFI